MTTEKKLRRESSPVIEATKAPNLLKPTREKKKQKLIMKMEKMGLCVGFQWPG